MKSLNTIQKLSKIGRVLSKITFIFSVIGFCSCISLSHPQRPAQWFPCAAHKSLSHDPFFVSVQPNPDIPARCALCTPSAPFHLHRIFPCMGNLCTAPVCFGMFVCPPDWSLYNEYLPKGCCQSTEAFLFFGKYSRSHKVPYAVEEVQKRFFVNPIFFQEGT